MFDNRFDVFGANFGLSRRIGIFGRYGGNYDDAPRIW